MQLRSNTWEKDLCAPPPRVRGMAQNTFIKTRGNNLTRPEHTSRHNVLTKHFHMARLQPDFSLRAKALWVVSWLFLWPPQWSQFPVRSYSVSVCVIRPAGISSSHLTEKRDPEKQSFQLPGQVQKPWPAYSRSSFIQSQRTINPTSKFIMDNPARQNAAMVEHMFNSLLCSWGRTAHGANLTIWEIDKHSKLPGNARHNKKRLEGNSMCESCLALTDMGVFLKRRGTWRCTSCQIVILIVWVPNKLRLYILLARPKQNYGG